MEEIECHQIFFNFMLLYRSRTLCLVLNGWNRSLYLLNMNFHWPGPQSATASLSASTSSSVQGKIVGAALGGGSGRLFSSGATPAVERPLLPAAASTRFFSAVFKRASHRARRRRIRFVSSCFDFFLAYGRIRMANSVIFKFIRLLCFTVSLLFHRNNKYN